MKVGFKQLVEEAEREIETLTVEQAKALVGDDNIQFVDLRDVRELWREGKIPGAVHAPRGMLEFWVDPESPYYRDVFGTGKKLVFYCCGRLALGPGHPAGTKDGLRAGVPYRWRFRRVERDGRTGGIGRETIKAPLGLAQSF